MQKHPKIQTAFVSTNSLSQGEQVRTLWEDIFKYGIEISFAHQTFHWKNEAKDVAEVYCIIIGFNKATARKKKLYRYEDINGDPTMHLVDNISAYLTEGISLLVKSANSPISQRTAMTYGNKPSGKAFFLTPDEKDAAITADPSVAPYIKRFHGADEFLHGGLRYCYWFADIDDETLKKIPSAQTLIEKIRLERQDPDSKNGNLKSHHEGYPLHLFRQITQPSNCDCLLVPRHSSERRKYIPMGYINAGEIIGDSCQMVPEATLFDFGIMTSNMHMTWMRTVCGRLKSDYRYSRDLCYNTFPWPKVSDSQRKLIENLSQNILMIREFYPDMTLADLYDPDKMPEDLKKSHNELDLAVDRLYRKRPFASDEERLAHLFARYEKLVKGEDDAFLFNE